MLFDTHAHLNSSPLINDLDNILTRAKEARVSLINVVGYDLETSKKAVELAMKYPFIYASVGIHPTEVKKAKKSDFLEIEKLVSNPKVIAVGEVGLDYYHDQDNKDQQQEYLERFIFLANKYNKPLVIHARDCFFDIHQVFLKNREYLTKGVMHCYSGSLEMALEFIKLGFYIGFDGPLTFKNARVSKEVASLVPLSKIVVETDCPYLTPHPFRGKINEPSYLPLIINELALIKDFSVSDIETIIFENSKRLFNL